MSQRRVDDARRYLRDRLLHDVPALTAAEVEAVITEARVDMPRTVHQLDRYLREHPEGLVAPDVFCPAGIVRLTHVLCRHGHQVTPPACPRCHRRVPLPHQRPEGRVCENCRNIDRPRITCTGCGRTAPPAAHYGDDRLCRRCYRTDPRSHRECAHCGRMRMLEHRTADGRGLCPQCAPRPHHLCIDCGRSRPAQAVLDAGPVCAACYRRHQPRRRCGQCGADAVIAVRADSTHPDMCTPCWYAATHPPRQRTPSPSRTPPQPKPRTAVRDRRRDRTSEPSQSAPRPKPTVQPVSCCLCERTRRALVYWPIGPVCQSCYSRRKEHPARCARCHELRVLIARSDTGDDLCGPCGGSSFDYRCRRCGEGGRVYAAGQCFRCCVETRLQQVLGGDSGVIPEQLEPLADALLAAAKPRSVLVWLQKGSAAQLLPQLAAAPITHAVLDALPPGRDVNILRAMFVQAGVLPDRTDEYLDRILPWLDALLASGNTHHASLVRPYAQWHLIHRARRRAHRRGVRPSASTAYGLRYILRVTVEFLTWLDHRQIELGTLTQKDVDAWLVEGTGTRRYCVRDFLKWAIDKRLAPRTVDIPAVKVGQPKNFIDTADYTQQLHRCLHDPDIPIDLRVTGALILLFGLRLPEVLDLRTDHVHVRDGDQYIRLGRHELLVPPALGVLLDQLPRTDTNRSVLPAAERSAMPLFPGFHSGRPVTPEGHGARLLEHGITPLAGRNTALATLAADLPAVVLADLLGIHPQTAVRWVRIAKRDWHTYLAHRRADLNIHGVGEK
ncbi:hypothetical protein F8M49_21540 [Rhodococcus zopfii]|uniref:Uncharacterized protein n=1 Tax=Rhodococcus zopfii TaxID=43772 RepID=A0ABU3WTH6_9NOCA|nr:hypothetical protein [Rhodococcus zopfii]